jgi:hypothetical protein
MSNEICLSLESFCRKRIEEIQIAFTNRWNVPYYQHLGNYEQELESAQDLLRLYSDTISIHPELNILLEYDQYVMEHQDKEPEQLDLWGNPL